MTASFHILTTKPELLIALLNKPQINANNLETSAIINNILPEAQIKCLLNTSQRH
jgi:hypothetical protein